MVMIFSNSTAAPSAHDSPQQARDSSGHSQPQGEPTHTKKGTQRYCSWEVKSRHGAKQRQQDPLPYSLCIPCLLSLEKTKAPQKSKWWFVVRQPKTPTCSPDLAASDLTKMPRGEHICACGVFHTGDETHCSDFDTEIVVH